MKFAILGRTHWLLDALETCVNRGHQPVLIGTCPAAPEYRVNAGDFEAAAKQHHADYFCDTNINKRVYREQIASSGAEIALSINWTTLIKPEVFNAFKHGVVNAHAGDLPRFRGNACPNWAILSGESQVVLSIHQMAEALDAGPIFLQRAVELTDTTYVGDVYDFLDETIPELMGDLLDGLQAGTLVARPQSENPADALRCFPRRPEDNEIAWTESAAQISRVVRAGSEPFSGAYTHLNGERLAVWRARTENIPYATLGYPGQVIEIRRNGEVAILTEEGAIVLEEVETETGWRGHPSEVIRSTRTRLGQHASAEMERLRSEIAELKQQITQLGAARTLPEETTI